MRTALLALILMMTARAAWADSPVAPPAILQISMTTVDDTLEYSFANKPRDRHQLEELLTSLRTMNRGKALPVVQIGFGKGSREVTASELVSFLDMLQDNGFTQISLYRPNRVGMVLRRQPVVIESAPAEREKK